MAVSELVNYDISSGLDVSHFSLVDPRSYRRISIPGEQLMPTTVDDGVAERVVVDVYAKDRISGSIDSRVHYTLLNRGVDDPGITLISLQIGGSFQDQGFQDNVAELIRANPSRRFLVFDNLGYGRSDPLAKSAARELVRTGRFDIYAETVHKVLSSVIEDYDYLDIIGRSEGGLIGTEMILHTEGARNVVVFDPPSTPMPLRKLFTKFAVLEKAHGEAYLEALSQAGFEKPEWDLSREQIAKMLITDLIFGRTAIQFRDGRTMAKGKYGDILSEALPLIANRYTFLSPQQSEMNTPQFIRQMIINSANKASQPPNELEHVVFNGTHAFAYGNSRALPTLETQASE
ncbi:MAG TPA: alpha/beta hydrolase [Candidatus Saccharimonadales bacterium]